MEEELNEKDYTYKLPDLEPGQCFWDDNHWRTPTFFRFNQKVPFIGSYDCDMIQVYDSRIVVVRRMHNVHLHKMKEMSPEQFKTLEDIAVNAFKEINSAQDSIVQDLKNRHSRRIRKKKE